MGILDYSTNPANNGVVGGVQYWPEGMLPGQVNDTGRQMMADHASWLAAPYVLNSFRVGTTGAGGTGTATLVAGNTGKAGYVEFRNPDATRNGFVGYNTPGGAMLYTCETNAGHTFVGGLMYRDGAVVYDAATLTSTVLNSIYGYTPLSGITGSMVSAALGFTPYNASNPSGYISGINAGMVSGALGFAPQNSTAGSNGNGQWERRPNGVIEQWGRYSGTLSDGNTIVVTFPVAFTDATTIDIQAIALNAASSGAEDCWVQTIGNETTTQVTLFVQGSTGTASINGIRWRAIGK